MAAHEYLTTGDVQYDPDNPRIAHDLESFDEPDHKLIGLALSPGDSKFLELKQSIESNQGIVHPIIVSKKGDQYLTIEGNTRLAIYKTLHQQNPDDETWATIPALVYEDMDSESIDAIRLMAHLVGVRNWAPYAKAQYLWKLNKLKKLPLNALVDFCGGNKLEVLRNISAYETMDKKYRPLVPEDEFDRHKFSLFLEAEKPKIKEALSRNGFTEEQLIEWVVQGKFAPRQELIRQLPKILENERARQEFFISGADAATRYIDRPEVAKELLEATLPELCSAINTKVRTVERREIQDIRNDDDAAESLRDALLALKNFLDEELRQE